MSRPPGAEPGGQAGDPGRSERIGRYELGALSAELDFIERVNRDLARAAARVPGDTLPNNLRHRPHIVQLIESRPGGMLLTLAQHVIWALRHRVRLVRGWQDRRRRRVAPEAAPHLPAAPSSAAPSLSDLPFDRAILDTRPRMLIDVTPTARQPGARGGIPRVVRELAEAAVITGAGLPVCIRDGALHSYFEHPLLRGPIVPGRGDVFVIVDVFWYFLDDYRAAIRLVRTGGAQVALMLHDIFPLQFPSFYPAEVPPTFKSGLLTFLAASDFCLTTTEYGMHEVRRYLLEIGFPGVDRLSFGHFPLGVAHNPVGVQTIRTLVSDLFDTDRAILSVGTIEPRKGYGVTLDACELAWKDGSRFVLVILGRYGWRSHALRERIRGHPEIDKRLFWIEDANDSELAYAYARCRSLVQSSIGEGYGLPVIEAARFNAPVIASDLPQFKEIAGEAITYYRVGDAADLALKLAACLTVARRPTSLPAQSWPASVRALAACVEPPGERSGSFGRLYAAPSVSDPQATAAADLPRIHVACCFDDRMAMPAAVVAASVAATTTDAHVTFHMLRPRKLSVSIDALKSRLDSPAFTISDCIIDQDLSSLHQTDQYSDAMYYRFLLPDIVDSDRIIYLDSDTMVRRSLLDLYRVDLGVHPLAAMQDYSLTYHMRDHGIPINYKGRKISVNEYYAEILDFPLTTTRYFNSGVLVMDLARWRELGIAERCFTFCREFGELNMADQDAANHILRGDFMAIDPRWNSFSYMFKEYFPAADSDLPGIFGGFEKHLRAPSGEWQRVLMAWAFDPWIVHFAYRSKPWHPGDRRTDYDAEFWDNAFRTPFGRELSSAFAKLSEGLAEGRVAAA